MRMKIPICLIERICLPSSESNVAFQCIVGGNWWFIGGR